MLGDRFEVLRDGEELEVYNWVNIKQPAIVRGDNPAVEKFEAEIGAGDSSMHPDHVTEEVAEELWHEFGIEVEKHDIEAVDVESDDVELL
jgi:hypothetical protein